ncbi:hypothetical protein JCM16303_003504 [Sporobolomyces ruberrimus]
MFFPLPSHFDLGLEQPFTPFVAPPPLDPLSHYHSPAVACGADIARPELERALLAQERRQRLAEQEEAAILEYYRQQQRQVVLEKAIREEEERRELERAWRHRQESIRKAMETEAIQAREREIARLRQFQEQERAMRSLEADRTQQESPFDPLFKALLFPHLRDHPSSSSVITPPAPTLLTPSAAATPLVDHVAAFSPNVSHSESTQASTSIPAPFDLFPRLPDVQEAARTHEDSGVFQRHLARRAALENLASLASSFSERQSTFVDPTSFTFQSSPSDSTSASGSAPHLAFGSANSSFLAHEDFLVNLLSKIDAVQSGGDRQVKQERKELVKKVEKELARLDAMRERAWEEQVKEAQNDLVQDQEMEDSPTQVKSTSKPCDPISSSTPPHPTLTNPRLKEDAEDTTLPPPLPPLTREALSSLPSPSPRPFSPSPSDSGSSATSSTLTVSSHSSQVDQYISEMLRRAQKLGEEVEQLELAESAKPLEPVLVA